MKYRKESGANINENSWVLRNLWDVTTPMGKGVITIPKKLKSTGVKRLIENLSVQSHVSCLYIL
jgi:hypothetical protein